MSNSLPRRLRKKPGFGPVWQAKAGGQSRKGQSGQHAIGADMDRFDRIAIGIQSDGGNAGIAAQFNQPALPRLRLAHCGMNRNQRYGQQENHAKGKGNAVHGGLLA